MMTTATAGAFPPATLERESAFTGTAALLRFQLRRDRIKLPAWTLGLSLFWLYYTRLVPTVYGDELESAARLVEGGMGRLWTGPGYGFDDLTIDRFVIGGYGLYILVLAALMNILLVVRHTRLEEQSGRAELVRADVVGRHAALTATLMLAFITNAVLATLVAVTTMTAAEFGVGGALLFSASTGSVGLAFAGLAALTAQVTAFSRAAAGLAGAGLGAAYLLRALGDMTREHGSALSWLSPLGWAQQTAPYVLDRWWPVALLFAFAAITAGTAFMLSSRRDVGASMFSVRAGRAGAATWLRSPLALAFRLQRAGVVGWSVSLATAGVLFGAWTDALLRSVDDLPEVLIDVIGRGDEVVDGYLSLMALMDALLVGVFVVLAMLSLRGEETSGRADPVLATPVSRVAWLGGFLGATTMGAVIVLAAAGIATGVGAAIVTGDTAYVWQITAAHVTYLPPLLLVLALATMLFGLAPKLVPAVWAVLAYATITGIWGPAMKLPEWTYRLSPFEHVARIPLDDFSLLPLVIITVLAAAAAALGVRGISRRDINAV